MLKRNKLLFVIGITIAVILTIFGVVMLSIALSVKSPDDVMDSYDKQIEMSITSFPTDLIIYGDDCNLRKKAVFRQVSVISDETLDSSDSYLHKVIIINDLFGNATLSGEDIDILYRYVVDGEYHFYYFGTRYLEDFLARGFYQNELQPDSCGFGVRHVANRTSVVVNEGMWTTGDYDIYEAHSDYLGQIIFAYLKRIYSDNA